MRVFFCISDFRILNLVLGQNLISVIDLGTFLAIASTMGIFEYSKVCPYLDFAEGFNMYRQMKNPLSLM